LENYYGIIIGFGKGGKTLAGDLAAQGKRVAIIEKSDQMYGGTCINVGCIPTKSLVTSAKLAQTKASEIFDEKAELYRSAIEEKRRVTTMLRGKNFDKLNNNKNVKVYTGTASFLSSNQVSVELENETVKIEGEYVFINTGSSIIIPEIEGIESNPRVYTSESFMELSALPKRLAIIGGGHIGLEFASIYSNFGSEVTIFDYSTVFMPREDEDIAKEILKVFTEKGIEVKLGSKINAVINNPNESVVSYFDGLSGEEKEFKADAVLIATGRKPNTEGLNLSLAGVEVTQRSAVKVDEYLQTTVPNIWALGDVVGGYQFTYISLDDYRIVRSQLVESLEKRSTKQRKNVPFSLFIDPAYSRVGLNEKEAKEQGYEVKIALMPTSAVPKAQVIKETKGILKAVIDAKTNNILGAMLFCAESYEVINVIKLAMDADLPYTFLRDQVYTHPTMTESLNDLFSV
jgi:pyruvate/2-oxoglutarate dehydrogenase complex dihydrolipoamide dehydrogenase (E3) component